MKVMKNRTYANAIEEAFTAGYKSALLDHQNEDVPYSFNLGSLLFKNNVADHEVKLILTNIVRMIRHRYESVFEDKIIYDLVQGMFDRAIEYNFSNIKKE